MTLLLLAACAIDYVNTPLDDETPVPRDSAEETIDTGEPTTRCDFVVTSDPAGVLQASVLASGGLESPVSLGVEATHPVIADVDADGYLEVLAWSADRLVQLDGDPCVGETMGASTLGRAFPPQAVGDLDGDGVADVLGWTDAGQGVVGLGSSSGFTWINVDVADALSSYVSNAAYRMEDVTGDGHADLVVASYDGYASDPTRLSIVPGNGDGTLGITIPMAGVDEPSNGADLWDVDGDGRVDLVVGLDDDGDAGQVYVAWGTADGLDEPEELLDIQPSYESGTNNAGQGTLRAVDLDDDGDHDLLILHRPNGGDFQSTELVRLEMNSGFGSPSAELMQSQLGAKLTLAVPR